MVAMVAAQRGERGVEIYRSDRHQRTDRVVVDLGAIARSDMRRALRDAFLDLARCVGEQIIVHQIILMDAEQQVDDRDGEPGAILSRNAVDKDRRKHGRAPGRARVCTDVSMWGGDVTY